MKNSLLFTATCLLLSAGCTRTVYVTKTVTDSTSTTVHYITRDTLIQLPPDSAAVQMYLECDSTGQVLLRQIETLNGQLIEARTGLANNVATVIAAVKPAATVEATLTDRTAETTHRRTEAEVIIKEVPRQYRWWEKLFFWTGVATVAAGILWIICTLKK
jgi:hypothetical protein